MISHITDDDDTRRSLFPPPGSTKRNGGLPKKHYHFLLAKNCFEDHPVYGEAFKNAVAAKQGDVWAGKIKNRVKAYVLMKSHFLRIHVASQGNRQDPRRGQCHG
jgi:hypothetical protein